MHQLGVRNLELKQATRCVDRDSITFLHQSNGSSHRRLGGHMPYYHAVSSSREPAIGYQPN
jgi:hypothetical protein